MIILITGGSGYLAPILSQFFAVLGHQVIIASRAFIDTSLYHTNVFYFQLDWSKEHPFDGLDYDVDCIIHASGLNSHYCAKSLANAFTVNCLFTTKLLEYASLKDNRLFFFLSTVHVYGHPLQGVIDEFSPTTNLHPYAISNYAGELAVRHFFKHTSLTGSILRMSNIFGAPFLQKSSCWQLFVNDICLQSVTKREITIHNDPNIRLDIVPVCDLCNVVNFLLSLRSSDIPEIVNISCGTSYSLLEIANNVTDLTSSLFSFSPQILSSPILDYHTDRSLTLSSKSLESLNPPFVLGSSINTEIIRLLNYVYSSYK